MRDIHILYCVTATEEKPMVASVLFEKYINIINNPQHNA